MSVIGYTPKQAHRLKHKVERQVAKIEDAALDLKRIVPDCDANRYADQSIEIMLEQFREIGYGLQGVVDRRTRPRRSMET